MFDEIPYIIMAAMSNCTSNFNTGVNLIGPVFMIGITLGIITILLYVSSSFAKYQRFKKLFRNLAKTFSYAAYGALTIVVIGIPCLLGYLGLSVAADNPEGSFEMLKWIGIIVGGFIGLSLLGYATKNRIWKRVFSYHRQEREYKETAQELPGTTE